MEDIMATDRSVKFQLRFTPEEREQLQAAADRNGMSLSAFLRFAALKVSRDG